MFKTLIIASLLLVSAASYACSGCGCSAKKAKVKKAEQKVVYIDKDKLQELIKAGDNLAVVDVLSPESYAKSHIKGAINIPVNKLKSDDKALLDSLKKYKTVVVYCASEKCSASTNAAKLLMKNGLKNVLDYKGGIADWKQNKLPVEAGDSAKK